MAIYPVILAGGGGTRLWPISRQNHPKQYLDLLGVGETLLQSTIKRAQACSDFAPLIIANKDNSIISEGTIYLIIKSFIEDNGHWLKSYSSSTVKVKYLVHPDFNNKESLNNWSTRLISKF